PMTDPGARGAPPEQHDTPNSAPDQHHSAAAAIPAPPATPASADHGPAHKLWGGRFAAGPAEALDALNRSIGTDFRLWPHDIRLSQAWAVALWQGGVISLEDSQALEAGLGRVGERLAAGAQPEAS